MSLQGYFFFLTFVIICMDPKVGFQVGPSFPTFLLGSYVPLFFLEKVLLSLIFW